MKILYLDFLCPKAHLNLDINQINRLSNIAEVVIISQKDRYKNLPIGVKNIEKDTMEIKSGKIRNRLSSMKIMLISAIESKKIDYDCIIVSSFETIIFSIGKYFFRKNDKIILFHHFNTDELSNNIKAWFFKRYMNKVIHIVYSEFIKNYLIDEFDIVTSKIFVLPHHMNKIEKTNSIRREFRCVGLSNSNDEEIISEIIRKEKEQELFKKANHKIVLKSKNYEFDNGYLKIVKGYLEKDVFDYYMNNTESVYMPFPSSFRYRMSGTLIDGLTNGKIVYGSDIPIIRYYSAKYPHICKVVDNSDEFLKIVLNEDIKRDKSSENFKKFKEDHSQGRIEGILKNILNANLG